MKITNIDSLKSYLKECYRIPIGRGTTAVCYLMKDGNVLKIFKDTFNTYSLKKIFPDLIDHFEKLNNIKNGSYISPDELLVLNGEVIAYIYKYVNAKTFKKVSPLMPLDQMFLSDGYKKLKEDTLEVSENGFELFDTHDENILFDGVNFYNIDLDFSNISTFKSADTLYSQNMRSIQKALIYSLFNIKSDKKYDLFFKNQILDELYNQAIYRDENQIAQLIEELEKRSIKTKLDIKVKKHSLVRVERNDYYNRLF